MRMKFCMKKLTVFLLALAASVSFAHAQLAEVMSQLQPDQVAQLPTDPYVRTGKVNGLTYYVRSNNFVPDRAEFYIVQNVGSILEKPEQRGLAHFLEHMAFNGTKHFPGKSLINYLETIGVKFGANLNAYTSVDKTVYYFTGVPVERASVADSCLLILRDWSDGILLENSEIDKERGVIEEEWRTRDNHNMRMYEQILPEIYAGSKYSDCMPIGNIDVVRNFNPDVLRAYYKEWYRPDLQAVIVVGDVDAEYVEDKIKEIFADCRVPENASERIWYPVPDNKEPIIVSTRDKENTSAGAMICFKHDVFPREYKNSALYYIQSFEEAAICQMLNNRFEEIAQKPESPFSFVSVDDCEFFLSATKRAFEYYSGCSDKNLRSTLVRMFVENERMTRYGFTMGEYERAKAEIIKGVEKAYNERNKTPNSSYSQEYIANFTEGDPFPGIIIEYPLYKQIAESVTLEQINMLAKHPLDGGNVVIWLRGTEKERVEFPSKSEILSIMDSVRTAEIEPYVDDMLNVPLVGDLEPGYIVKEKMSRDSVYTFTLSNEVTVEVKPTKLKDDEVLMKAISMGGMSRFYSEGDNVNTLKLINDMASVGGLGKFSAINLQKALAGKNAGIKIRLGHYSASLSGTSGEKDLETLMQLIHLGFTSVRYDHEAYLSLMNQYDTYLKAQDANPAIALHDSIISVVYDNNPLMTRLKAEDLQKASYPQGLGILKAVYGNAKDFRFVFTGNIDIEAFKPLMCKYIASLPSEDETKPGKAKDFGIMPVAGSRELSYRKQMENPKTTVNIVATGKIPYNLKNIVAINALDHILDIVYFENVREEDGGTYGVKSSITPSAIPYPHYTIQLSFDTDSAKYEKLLPLLFGEIEKIAADGPRAEDLQKTKEYFLKKYTDAQVENSYWLGVKSTQIMTGLDSHTKYKKTVESLNAGKIKSMAKKLLKKLDVKEVVQIGAK